MEAGHPSPPPLPAEADRTVVLVPVKRFDAAKGRLAADLDRSSRCRLARVMAERVVAAAAPMRVAVVCDDADVAEWAGDRGARVLWEGGDGLDGCVARAVDRLGAEGADRVVVAHGDLPLATSLAAAGWWDADVVMAPDRRADGTNVLAVPTGAGFRFSYGPGSWHRHRAEAQRLGLAVATVRRADLALDVDSPDDLAEAVAADPTLLAALSEAGSAWVVPVAGS